MRRFLFFIFLSIFIFGCTKKTNMEAIKADITEEITINETEKQIVEEIELQKEEKEIRKIENPLKLYKEYTFSPIQKVQLDLVSMELKEENNIEIIYDGITILVIDDIGANIQNVLNLCEPYNSNRLFTSSFLIFSEDAQLCGIISFTQGVVKIYNWETEIKCWPYYSGVSKYYLIENDWIEKESYYDYTTFKTIPAVYNGCLLLIDVATDEVVYHIDRKLLHDTIALSIDKIAYESDGFRITIGNYYDSDEFVDFKLSINNAEFSYEIYDKYSYADEE